MSRAEQLHTPLISLCMIVRNEAEALDACLESAASWVDEMVVCDTGSTDGTVRIARARGARVVSFPWCDDFSAARNYALCQARGLWALSLDADEMLDPESGPRLRELALFPVPPGRQRAYQILVRHYHDQRDASQRTEQYFARLFHRHPRVGWSGRIHEHLVWLDERKALPLEHVDLVGADPATKPRRRHGQFPVVRIDGQLEFVRLPEVIVHHTGHRKEKRLEQGKDERNLRLLRLATEEEPADGYYPFKLAQHELDAGRWETARDYALRALELDGGSSGSSQVPEWLPQAHVVLTAAHLKGEQTREARLAAEAGLQFFPDYAPLWYQLGTIRLLQQELDEAERCYRQAVECGRNIIRWSPDPGMGTWRPLHALASLKELRGDDRTSLALYREALEYAPQNGELALSAARVLARLSEWCDAELLLLRFFEGRGPAQYFDESDDQLLVLFADCLLAQGEDRLPEAIERLQDALTQYPGLRRTRVRLGWLLCDQAEHRRTLEVLAPGLDDPAAPAEMYECLGRALWELGRIEDSTNAMALAASKRGELQRWLAGFDRSDKPQAFGPFHPPARPFRIGLLLRSGGVLFSEEMLDRKPLGGTETALLRMARTLRGLGHEVYVEQLPERLQRLQGVDVLIMKRHPLILDPPLASATYFWVPDDVDQPFWDRLRDPDYRERFLQSVNKIFALSQYHALRMMETGVPQSKIYITRNGFDPRLFEDLPPSDRDVRPPRCVYTSDPSRGLEILLDVWPSIRRRVPHAQLQIFSSMRLYVRGATEKPQHLALYERARDLQGVEYVGSVPQPELARALKNARLLLYPNVFRETSCIAALEAQAAGCAVVTSCLGALPETAWGNALIFGDPRSADYQEHFVDRTVDLLTNDLLWRQLSQQNRERMRAYTWESVAREWLAVMAADLGG